MEDTPTLSLNEDTDIPVIGLGTWELDGDTCKKAVTAALDCGYRHIDTAAAYGNQEAIGEAIQKSSHKRDDLFITSKVWRTNLSVEDVQKSCEQTLDELQTDYLDLLLIHWPNKEVPLEETLGAMEKLREDEYVKAVGVSNFTVHRLEDALETGAKITNNQVEFHPTLNQKRLKRFCDEHDLVITAYSPLAKGDDLKRDLIQHIAQKHNRPEAQVVLNWIIQKGMVAIPRSKNPDHIKENIEMLKWSLDEEDIKAIDGIGLYDRMTNPPFAEFDAE